MSSSDTTDPVGPPILPPPPPAIDPRPTPLQQRVLLALLAAGMVLLVLGYAVDVRHAALVRHAGFFLVCYVLVVSASWLPQGLLSRRIDRFLDRWIANGASGFYGMMALSTYVRLELASLWTSILEFDPDSHWLRDAIVQSLMGFSLASLKNFVAAMAWPATLFGKGGSGFAPVATIAACWGAYELGRRVLPQETLRRKIEKQQQKQRAKRERKASSSTP